MYLVPEPGGWPTSPSTYSSRDEKIIVNLGVGGWRTLSPEV
jgi:hypothetical protein